MCINTIAFTEKETNPDCADILNSFDLFQGTELGYELERSPKRIEALVMIIRLTGKE